MGNTLPAPPRNSTRGFSPISYPAGVGPSRKRRFSAPLASLHVINFLNTCETVKSGNCIIIEGGNNKIMLFHCIYIIMCILFMFNGIFILGLYCTKIELIMVIIKLRRDYQCFLQLKQLKIIHYL